MQPYYEANGIQLFLGDCREVLPQLVGCQIRAIVTGPPYGEINADKDWRIKPAEYAGLLKACAGPTTGAALFCSTRFAFELHPAMVAAQWRYWTNFVWQKQNGGPKMQLHMPCASHEHVLCYLPLDADVKRVTFNGYESGEYGVVYKTTRNDTTNDVYTKRRETDYQALGHPDGKRWVRSVLKGINKPGMPVEDRTSHPTQKPLETVSRLLLLLTNPGDLVLDPFLGSGTTAHACKNLGRWCIGIEKNEAYLLMATKRLQQEVMVF